MSELDLPEGLGQLSEWVLKLRELDSEIEAAKEVLACFQKERDRLSEEVIPDLMFDLGINALELNDGRKLTCEKAYFAKIPEDKRSEAFEWLSNNGYEALIKREITTLFNRGESDKADELVKHLEDTDASFRNKHNVHPQTLKALVKERYQEGKDMPEEVFGIFVKNVTKIK